MSNFSINQVELMGNVGIDPESYQTRNGTKIVRCTLATSYQPQNGPERTEWHRLTFWNRNAEIVEQYVQKGDRLLVHGRLHYSQWTDDNNQPRTSTEINVDRVFLLSPSRQNGNGNGYGNGNGNSNHIPWDQDEVAATDASKLPFS